MLGLTEYEPLPALELTRPSRQVKPALAFLLSLLCPGLGHLYIGLFSRAAWIFFSELLCLAFLALQGPLQVAAVLSIPTIYCFAMIDAYFGAREWNAGATSLLEGTNPQPAIASVLFTIIGLSLLLGYVALRAINGRPVKSRGTLEQGPSGLIYTDALERYSVVLPDGWSPLNPDGAQALFAGDGASLLTQEQYALYPVSTLLDATEKELRVQYPNAERAPCTATIGPHPAACMEVRYMTREMTHITQRFIAIRRGLKFFVLIESWNAGERPSVMDRVEQNLQLR